MRCGVVERIRNRVFCFILVARILITGPEIIAKQTIGRLGCRWVEITKIGIKGPFNKGEGGLLPVFMHTGVVEVAQIDVDAPVLGWAITVAVSIKEIVEALGPIEQGFAGGGI